MSKSLKSTKNKNGNEPNNCNDAGNKKKKNRNNSGGGCSSSSSSSSFPTLLLTKKERGRLKKLRKIAFLDTSNNNNNDDESRSSCSGITSLQVALELRTLLLKSARKEQQEENNNNTNKNKNQNQNQQEQKQQFSESNDHNNDDVNSTSMIQRLGPSIHLLNSQETSTTTQESDVTTTTTTSNSLSFDDGWKQTESINHRDLLRSLVFQTHTNNSNHNHNGKNKKRKRSNDSSADSTTNHNHNGNDDDEGTSSASWQPKNIPSWARVHNLGCMEGVAVIEICLDSKLEHDNSYACMPSHRIMMEKEEEEETIGKHKEEDKFSSSSCCSNILKKLMMSSSHDQSGSNSSSSRHHQRRVLPLKMRSFQGDRPRHLTDMMMYIDKPTNPKKKQSTKKRKTTKSNSNNDDDGGDEGEDEDEGNKQEKDMFYLLESLILSEKDRKREGYPRLRHSSTTSRKEDKSTIGIKHETSKSFITTTIQKIANDIGGANNSESSSRIDNLPFSQKEASSLVKQYQIEVCGSSSKNQTTKNQTTSKDNSDEGGGGGSESGTLNNNDDEEEKEVYISTLLNSKDISTRPKSTVFGIDCEMVETSAGKELARVTVIRLVMSKKKKKKNEDVDEENNNKEYCEEYSVILDSLVKPRRLVIDYLTQYSGITAKMLEHVTTRIEQIQATLVALICKDDIIVGHSLENDLRSLRLVHDKVIDTAIVFRSSNGGGGEDRSRKHSLKHLSACLLQKKIQQGNTTTTTGGGGKKDSGIVGHCSEEDAAASLILAVRRAYLGEDFKLPEKRNGRINIMDVVTNIRRRKNKHDEVNRILSHNGGPLVCIGPDEWIKEHVGSMSMANALICENIFSSSVKALTSYCRSGPRRASMIWAQLVVNGSDVEKSNKKIDEILEKLCTIDSSTTILLTFQRGFHAAKAISKQRLAMKDARSTLGWTEEQEEKWRKTLDIARNCEAFWLTS